MNFGQQVHSDRHPEIPCIWDAGWASSSLWPQREPRPLDVPLADVTVTGAVGNQSFGPRSWPGARPWGDLRARRAGVGDIRVEVAGARSEDRERRQELRIYVSKNLTRISVRKDTGLLAPG